ncbi:MAG: hypothetical protein NTY46_04670 [Candidatus Sumerlaeota bacterium]|nr:hypothetical protein [Candidatus Sumerlaeota bacterium]
MPIRRAGNQSKLKRAESSAGVGARRASARGRWIWVCDDDVNPKNRFTYFRKVAELKGLPADASLRFAADSNAWLWVNGHVLRRKMTRYHEEEIRCEVVNAAPYLVEGPNVVVVLHHNWGDVPTFQRSGNRHAGLYIDSSWLQTDESWRCARAPEFAVHDQQIRGIVDGANRIRYPQVVDGRKAFGSAIHQPDFDDSDWAPARVVAGGPWPEHPDDVETPGQREYAVCPGSVLAAGRSTLPPDAGNDPITIAGRIRNATHHPDPALTEQFEGLVRGKPVSLQGRAGDSLYVTFDFGKPVHGYPWIDIGRASAGAVIDFGYCELHRALYDSEIHITPDGKMNTEGVAGTGYADRYITANHPQRQELPDERTARWLSLHFQFPRAGKLTLNGAGFVKSQYPIRPIGSFECGNERIGQIVKLCLTHAEVTMTDAYVDTPGREDGQWIEDAQPRALISERWFGDTALRQVLVRCHAEGQGDDGDMHPFAPSNFPAYPAVYDWSLQWVATLFDEFMWSANRVLLDRHWSTLCRYWNNILAHVDARGLWLHPRVLADIRVGLHAEDATQSSGIVTPWLIERLRWSAAMAKAAGRSSQAGKWSALAGKIADAFRTFHLVPASGGIPLHVADRCAPGNPKLTRGFSQAGQTIALTAGLLSNEEAGADLDYAFPDPDGSPPPDVTRWNNPAYCSRALSAMSACGRSQRAVRHLLERYAPYLPAHPANPTPLRMQGPAGGPIPEYWVSREDLGLRDGEVNTAQPEDETGSHGWGATPLLWMHEWLLGVRTLVPGGARIAIAPDAAGLPFVAGHTVTPRGPVWVYLDSQQWKLEIAIPDGVAADVRLPGAWTGKRCRVTRKAGKATRTAEDRYRLTGGRGAFVLTVE